MRHAWAGCWRLTQEQVLAAVCSIRQAHRGGSHGRLTFAMRVCPSGDDVAVEDLAASSSSPQRRKER